MSPVGPLRPNLGCIYMSAVRGEPGMASMVLNRREMTHLRHWRLDRVPRQRHQPAGEIADSKTTYRQVSVILASLGSGATREEHKCRSTAANSCKPRAHS